MNKPIFIDVCYLISMLNNSYTTNMSEILINTYFSNYIIE